MADFLSNVVEWFYSNLFNFVYSVIAIVIIYVIYKFSINQIQKFQKEEKLDETVAFLLNRIFRWGSILIAVIFIVSQFGIKIDLVAGLFVLAGGTVIGFAAMNTIGNAIAGLILMISRPFNVGDRVLFEGTFADVEAIDLIYTRMRTMDNIMISIPNQKLLQTDLENYGKKTTVRRRHTITAGYEEAFEKVEAALIEAASQVKKVLKEPKPYVWITEFQNFSVEYTLHVFIKEIKHIQEIDSDIRNSILESCKRNVQTLEIQSLNHVKEMELI